MLWRIGMVLGFLTFLASWVFISCGLALFQLGCLAFRNILTYNFPTLLSETSFTIILFWSWLGSSRTLKKNSWKDYDPNSPEFVLKSPIIFVLASNVFFKPFVNAFYNNLTFYGFLSEVTNFLMHLLFSYLSPELLL